VTIDANNYNVATKLLFGGSSDYAVATRIFSSYHADETKFFKDPISGVIHAERGKRRAQYGALEVLLGTDSEDFSPLLCLVGLFCGPVFWIPQADLIGSWTQAIHDIVRRAKRKNNQIRYQLITRLARDLYDMFNASTGTLPDTWRFPWGDVPLSRACVAALHALCAYHLLSIHFGSKKTNLMGWGMDQICLTLDTADLIRELARISGIETSLVAPVVDALTWGVDTDAPDPALQPLIPVGRQKLAVPAILILSSNWARNMLSLHARVSQPTFDASSSVFEGRPISVR